MPKMMIATKERQVDRMQADRAELAARIARALPYEGKLEPQPGLHFHRKSTCAERVHSVGLFRTLAVNLGIWTRRPYRPLYFA